MAAALGAQEPNPMQRERGGSAEEAGNPPIYRVNVVARTTKAVNYGFNSRPTRVGLEGTVLLPGAEGEARIEASRGAVIVKAKLKNLPSPERFGRQYLTYVLWAITPEGRATNLGEIVTNGGNDGKLRTATELQTFALIVTAEPYYSVTQPSDVVVMENVIVPGETTGRIQTVDARYELLRRGEVTLDLSAARRADSANRPQVSMKEYESLLALYQAKNAIQLAAAAGASDHAPGILAKAQTRLTDAEAIYERSPKSGTIVTLAREATQAAEDARLVALRREKSPAPAMASPGG
jgi:hypothetical protein